MISLGEQVVHKLGIELQRLEDEFDDIERAFHDSPMEWKKSPQGMSFERRLERIVELHHDLREFLEMVRGTDWGENSAELWSVLKRSWKLLNRIDDLKRPPDPTGSVGDAIRFGNQIEGFLQLGQEGATEGAIDSDAPPLAPQLDPFIAAGIVFTWWRRVWNRWSR